MKLIFSNANDGSFGGEVGGFIRAGSVRHADIAEWSAKSPEIDAELVVGLTESFDNGVNGNDVTNRGLLQLSLQRDDVTQLV